MVKTAFGPIVLALALLAGCGGNTDSDEGDPDAAVPACRSGQTKAESCNTCVCTDGGEWNCTRLACDACIDGQTRRSDDGCTTCTCYAAAWVCPSLPCPTTPQRACGARAGNTCSATEYCAYEEGQLCGAADAEARCKPRPDSCNDIASPVCGCDGTTYANTCEAASAGSGVNHAGACR